MSTHTTASLPRTPEIDLSTSRGPGRRTYACRVTILYVPSVAEYALNSVKLTGITSVAVRGADCVCVITQRSKAPVVSARAGL